MADEDDEQSRCDFACPHGEWCMLLPRNHALPHDIAECTCDEPPVHRGDGAHGRGVVIAGRLDSDFLIAYSAFMIARARLADEARCVAPADDYDRAKAEWLDAGRPEIEPFIRERANIGPRETCSQCGAEVLGHHACPGVPGGFGDDEAGPR